ncbi:MAG: hypothetical protein WAM28_08265, partial [Chlamydiales bacterium]
MGTSDAIIPPPDRGADTFTAQQAEAPEQSHIAWVTENIVPLLQMQDQAEFLEQFRYFMEQLSIAKGPELGELVPIELPNPPSMPEGLEDFTLSSDYVSVEANYIEQLIQILEEGNSTLQSPELEALLEVLKTDLASIKETLPPTPNQITELNNMIAALNVEMPNMPPSVQREFSQTEVQMYDDLESEMQNEVAHHLGRISILEDQIEDPSVVLQRTEESKEVSEDIQDKLNQFISVFSAVQAFLNDSGIQAKLNQHFQSFKDQAPGVDDELISAAIELDWRANPTNYLSGLYTLMRYMGNRNGNLSDIIGVLQQMLTSPDSFPTSSQISTLNSFLELIRGCFDGTSFYNGFNDILDAEDIAEYLDLSPEQVAQFREAFSTLRDAFDSLSTTPEKVINLTDIRYEKQLQHQQLSDNLNGQLNPLLATLDDYDDLMERTE